MSKCTFFSDFSALNRKDAGSWVADCSKLADEALKNSSNKTRLLGNLLVLEQYFHTLELGLRQNNEKPLAVAYRAVSMLWDYLYGEIKPSDFEDFANNLYACVLEYMVGEELTDEQSDFYNKNFPDETVNSLQWEILSWASYLLLELTAIHGGRLDFDEFEEYDFIDFVQIDEMLNGLSDACIDFVGVSCPSCMAKDVLKAIEEVYQTPLFQSVVCKVQKSLKDALAAKREDYGSLKNEYRQCSILPEELAADYLKY